MKKTTTIHKMPRHKSAEWYLAKHSVMLIYRRFLRLHLITATVQKAA